LKPALTIVAFFSIFINSSYAAELNCKKLLECIEKVSKLTDRQYTLGAKLNVGNFQEVNFKGTNEEIEKLFSQILFNYGYTRVPSVAKSWMILAARDIRYNPTPLLDSVEGTVPDTYDYIMLSHQLKNRLSANEVTRSFRPFMSRYGRIISMKEEGKIIIQDTGVNVKRLLGLLKMTDKEPTEEQKRQAKKDRKFYQKLKLIEAKHPKCTERHHPHKG